jgi:hypothetical protein
MTEVNGPANIVMLIDLYFEGIHGGERALLKQLRNEAQKTVTYMQRHDVDPSVMWHQIEVGK